MRNKIRLTLFFGASVLLSGPIYASAGAAGCGPGSVILPKNTMVFQLLALWTNNALWGSHTSAITSGTSNCKADAIVKIDAEREYFASHHFEPLLAEMARGEGEYLKSFAEISGCQDTGLVSQVARTHFEQIVQEAHDGPSLIQGFDRVAGQHCSRLI